MDQEDLNRAIMERVLEVVECDSWRLQSLTLNGPEFLKEEECEHGESGCVPKGMVPDYCGSFCMAGSVMDHFRSLGCQVDARADPGDPWRVVFGSGESIGVGEDDFLPTAICLAAADYVGLDEEEEEVQPAPRLRLVKLDEDE